MDELQYSFIIPVYNRPNEISELLHSFLAMQTKIAFEIVVIEDGSTITSKAVIKSFDEKLNIAYYFKPNSGPGNSRNFGMEKASGNYFIILDSDCLLPPNYLDDVDASLKAHFVDCFGGPDAAHESFSVLQKAINFSMTSPLTTGGIRGGKLAASKFQPRSFNMGLSKQAFEATQGFGNIHPGEDPDLSIRLKQLGFALKLIPEAFVYHKRRISWPKFYTQVFKFGSARAVLNRWHPSTKRFVYWLPSLFFTALLLAFLIALVGIPYLLLFFIVFYLVIFGSALLKTKQLGVALLSILAVNIQFIGYGYGFLKTTLQLCFSTHKNVEQVVPHLFFK